MQPALDPVIHAPNRLQICALLSPLAEAEFAVLRDELGVSDSVLSKHIKQLEEAGYLKVRKGAMNGRQRTWTQLTAKGRAAFAAHVAELQRLANVANGQGSED
ncbi:MAG: transcriptional regulator [Maricaulaceae bacterium]|jgi:DNA-binding MarR family transcriptional regulator